jgi:hypothetical protein
MDMYGCTFKPIINKQAERGEEKDDTLSHDSSSFIIKSVDAIHKHIQRTQSAMAQREKLY